MKDLKFNTIIYQKLLRIKNTYHNENHNYDNLRFKIIEMKILRIVHLNAKAKTRGQSRN